MIENGEYFTINKPRQYGKTTTMYLLDKELKKRDDYLVIKISFEGIDAPTYARQEAFIKTFLEMLKGKFLVLQKNTYAVHLTFWDHDLLSLHILYYYHWQIL